MDEVEALPVATRPKRRFRIGLRGLVGFVLLTGLIFGLIAREHRRVTEQSALLADLAGMGVHGNGRPTLLCFIAMKVYSTNNRAIEKKFSNWLDPGWFYKANFFNAGHLKEEQLPTAVRLLGRFGTVKEVYYNEPPLKGLRLFYIDQVRFHELGVPRESCTFRDYPSADVE